MKNTFTGKTRLFLCISGAIIVIALVMQIAGVGLNLGIDFTGGSLLNYSVGEDYDISDVETILNSAGYTGSQLTKAAPSEASIARQAEIAAAEEAAAAAEAAAEEPPAEETAAEDTSAEDTAAEAAPAEETEAPTEEAPAEEAPKASLLNLDKSGIEKDGMTDLQIRLKLVDETEGMEDAITEAVKSVLPNAEKIDYVPVTNSIIVNKGVDGEYAGGYMAEFHVSEEFDREAVLAAVNAALADYNVNLSSAHAYDAEAEAAAAAQSTDAAEDTAAEEASAEEAPAEETPAEVEETGTDLRVLVHVDDQATRIRTLLETEMTAKYPHFTFITIDHVSAIAGRDLLSNAVKALLIAFVCMLIYIAIRFDVFSGLAALFGLVHDVLIMCSFMVFFRWAYQVNSSFIAAILTIVGYSINNTIIIFDRIRESAKKPGLSQLPRVQIVEESVSSTLSRTINTTLTTMITLVTLYIFGVESIREFAFPLVVGMIAGTYSSVLLSGQVWAMWMDKRMAKKAQKSGKKA